MIPFSILPQPQATPNGHDSSALWKALFGETLSLLRRNTIFWICILLKSQPKPQQNPRQAWGFTSELPSAMCKDKNSAPAPPHRGFCHAMRAEHSPLDDLSDLGLPVSHGLLLISQVSHLFLQLPIIHTQPLKHSGELKDNLNNSLNCCDYISVQTQNHMFPSPTPCICFRNWYWSSQ